MQTIKLNEGFDNLRTILKCKQIYPKSKSQVLYEATKYMRRLESRLDRLKTDNIQLKKLVLNHHYGNTQNKRLSKTTKINQECLSRDQRGSALVLKNEGNNKKCDQNGRVGRVALKRSSESKRDFLNNLLFRKLMSKQKFDTKITEEDKPISSTLVPQIPKSPSQMFAEPLDLSVK